MTAIFRDELGEFEAVGIVSLQCLDCDKWFVEFSNGEEEVYKAKLETVVNN